MSARGLAVVVVAAAAAFGAGYALAGSASGDDAPASTRAPEALDLPAAVVPAPSLGDGRLPAIVEPERREPAARPPAATPAPPAASPPVQPPVAPPPDGGSGGGGIIEG